MNNGSLPKAALLKVLFTFESVVCEDARVVYIPFLHFFPCPYKYIFITAILIDGGWII
jgi:hypothetical protein